MSYSTSQRVTDLAGTVAVALRTDDGTLATYVQEALDYADGEIDFSAQGRYDTNALVGNSWVINVATWFALEYLCERRLNAVPATVAAHCDRYREKLALVEKGLLLIPGAARSRRPMTVTNHVTDLRRYNNQERVDTTKSTGVAKNYTRPTDPTAPDQR